MKLLVIVVCLLCERFLMHSISYQRFSWFNDYCEKINHYLFRFKNITNPWAIMALTVLPMIMVVGIIYAILHAVLFGFLGLLFSVLIFYYCLGPNNPFYPITEESTETQDDVAVGKYLSQVNSQLFSVVFWYIVAGPIAVLTYRVITLLQSNNLLGQQAKQATDVLEWVPARITVLLYLLVGNFQHGLSAFTPYIFAKPNLNGQMIEECALQAISDNEKEVVPMPVAENLVEHATIVLLVLIALFTLVAWM